MELDIQGMLPVIAAINLAVGIIGWWVTGKDARAKTAKRLSAVAVGIGAAGLLARAPVWVTTGILAAWVATGGYVAWQKTAENLGLKVPSVAKLSKVIPPASSNDGTP